MVKLPAFQFYPGDWVQDTRMLSLEAKGAWIDILCALWRAQPQRGSLTLSLEGWARLIGASIEKTAFVLAELIEAGTCNASVTPVTLRNALSQKSDMQITLINRRMVREDKDRTNNALRQARFRQAHQSNALVTQSSLPPSSSSSSSSSSKIVEDLKKRSSPSSQARTLSCALRDAILARDPNARAGRNSDLKQWTRDIDLAMRLDHRSADQLQAVITWCQRPGCFWAPNILSGRKLREKFDTLWGQMNREQEHKEKTLHEQLFGHPDPGRG